MMKMVSVCLPVCVPVYLVHTYVCPPVSFSISFFFLLFLSVLFLTERLVCHCHKLGHSVAVLLVITR